MNKVFISGEKVDLCIPNEGDFEKWANWFNSQKTTEFLDQGKYPNTVVQQREFFENAVRTGRFLCLIKTKDGDLLGVISLSEINYEKSSCHVAYVCPEKSDKAPLAALEALALCVQHAFNRFGMSRVWAGHSYPGLKKWTLKTEAIGFKTDGVDPKGARHGIAESDGIRTSVSKERFLQLTNRRNGSLWAGELAMKKILVELQRQLPLAQQVHEAIMALHQKHDQLLADIEIDVQK